LTKLKFLLLGVLTSLLFPPYFVFPLGFIIFPYLCLFIEKKLDIFNKRQFFVCFFLFGIGFFGNFLFWIQNPFYLFEETKYFSFISIFLIIILSLILGLVSSLLIFYNKTVPIIFIIPIIFILSEVIISFILYGFPWVTYSLIVSNINLFSFSLKHFGTIITSFSVLILFCLPYLFLSKKNLTKITILFFSFILLPLFFSVIFNLFNNTEESTKHKVIQIDLYQLNKEVLLNNESAKALYENILNKISKSDSDLIIFAENNYPYLIKKIEFKNIQNILGDNQTIIIGGTRYEEKKYYNSLININKRGISYYDKKILVPFGEFLPFRNLLSILFKKISSPYDYSPGTLDRSISINSNVKYIPIICYEILFHWRILNKKNINDNFLVNITNDIWFGNKLGPYQHLYLSKIRASEFNKPVIRVSNNGISAIIDEKGKIINSTKLNKYENIKTTFSYKKNKSLNMTHKILNYYYIIILLFLFIINIKNLYVSQRKQL
tara:strand:+ start:228 stop:1706 length:1479 start_codon:yes stop_codon:yes gene_type:complete